VNRAYTRGLHDLGNSTYAWLAPDGGWGWSNAGLIVDGEESLLVDTLFDLRQTQEMLDAMRRAEPVAAKDIGTLVNTHANGDHCNGNELVAGAEIIASTATAEELNEFPPEALAQLQATLRGQDTPFARYFNACFGDFDFSGITLTPPTRTFDGELSLTVGDKRIELIEVGPAHTRGDVLIHVPDDRTLFTGDILFIEGTPLAWAGPIRNWIDACRRIEAMDLETIVPGHGPITDRRGVANVRAYFEHIESETRKRYDSGMSAADAARDIDLADFAGWGERERIVVNVNRLYSEFSGDDSPTDIMALFASMAEMAGY
jgi:glyoxylase-like metal-dependent hydrolase (beta-lactamase superfamily II)